MTLIRRENIEVDASLYSKLTTAVSEAKTLTAEYHDSDGVVT